MPNALQTELDARRQEIKTDAYPMSIGEIANLYIEGDLDTHPEFQRFFRWSETQRSKWIESILLGIPLPSIFVSQREDGVWDVVDGMQRLSTIFQLMGILKDEEGKLVAPLVLTRTKYLPALEGKTWKAVLDHPEPLTTEQQRYIKRAKLDIQIILRESDPSSKYELFQRLNTGGSSLSDQELRNCLMLSLDRNFYRCFNELCQSAPYQSCVSLSDRLTSLRYDMELALRFILLRAIELDSIPTYAALSEFLTDTLTTAMDAHAIDMEAEAAAFNEVFLALSETLGEDSFRKYDPVKQRFTGPFSVAAFEVVALGMGHSMASGQPKWSKETLTELVRDTVWNNPNFLTTTGLSAVQRLRTTLDFGRSIFG